MIQISDTERRRAFSVWLRTGRWPTATIADNVEVKFNPWHDPADGRFTFAGGGRNYGRGGAKPIGDAGGHQSQISRRSRPLGANNSAKAEPVRSRGAAVTTNNASGLGLTAMPPAPKQTLRGTKPSPTAEFFGGAGEGLYRLGKETVAGGYSLLTTNPITTVSNAAIGVAETIDSVLVAENTPTLVHVARAVAAVQQASPRDLGRATGSIVGKVGLAAVPVATLAKLSALSRLRAVKALVPYEPPQIGWAKETLTSDKPWKVYNDTATGARPGQAPTLTRTLQDGSTRPVKFDGVQGETLIDRKWSVSSRPRAKAQTLRQAEVLSQHRLPGVWEVPDKKQLFAARKMLKKLNITNIKVRIVKP